MRQADTIGLPRDKCVIHRQSRFESGGNGGCAQLDAILSTSFWLAAGRIHTSGLYRDDPSASYLSVDRSGSFDTLFVGDDAILGRVRKPSYSRFDTAASEPVPGPLNVDNGGDVDLRFRPLTQHAWIVEANDDLVGMCFTER